MKNNKLIYVVALFSLLITSCNDFLEIKDQSSINPAIWDNEESAKLYLNNIYSLSMTSFGGEGLNTSLANLSDETTDMSSGILLGTLSTSAQINVYLSPYETIRYINIAFDQMKQSQMTTDAKNRTLGQLYFFRAWMHWKMVNLYGGIPYMKEYVTFASEQEVRSPARDKTSVAVEYIKQDLDSAIAKLPVAWASTEYARITRAAAAAFKGRVLLFYASPQFNPNHDMGRWKVAYDANVEANNICLLDQYALKDISAKEYDFNQIFSTKKGADNKEVLLVTPYGTDVKTHGYENNVCPVELTSGTSAPSLCPSWDLVISYLMKDGSIAFKYNATNKNTRTFIGNGGDVTKYYLNREPRFYSSIAYNGGNYTLEGNTNRKQWNYNCPKTIKDPITNVKTTITYYAENTTLDKISPTGFYCKKMVNATLLRDNMGKSTTDWIEMRYAEVLLNLAECAFEYEGNSSAVGMDCLKQIRKRAGIEIGDGSYGINGNIATGLSPIEIVMNERRIEFAFEGKRFYDLRRRNMFTSDLGSYIYKLNGWKKSGSGFNFSLKNTADTAIFLYPSKRDTVKTENLYKYFTMTAKSTGPLVKAIAYVCIPDSSTLRTTNTGNYNFFDIPQDILTRSPSIKQNIGWQNGEFNPFQ